MENLCSVKQRRNKQDVYWDIRQKIITLELAPGTSLDEAELVQRYGVSRTPIRETLIRLHGEGLVDLRENRGAYVTQLDLPALQAYFEAADFIHSAVVRLAAVRRTAADLENIEREMLAFERAMSKEDMGTMVAHNNGFHEAIGLAARNDYLYAGYRRLLADHERISQLCYRHELETGDEATKRITLDQHRGVYDAIRNRAAVEAAEIALAHLNLCKTGLTEILTGSSELLDGIEMEKVGSFSP